MVKQLLPSDFRKLRKIVFLNYIPNLKPLYMGNGTLASSTNKGFYWRELVNIKLMMDFLIAYNQLTAPSVDNQASQTASVLLPFAIDFFKTMPEDMVNALNEEQQKTLKNLSMSSSMHLN